VQVEEDVDLNLPFLLPEDGYSPELVRGIPPALSQFVNDLCRIGQFVSIGDELYLFRCMSYDFATELDWTMDSAYDGYCNRISTTTTIVG
jgi:hypothetical protein